MCTVCHYCNSLLSNTVYEGSKTHCLCGFRVMIYILEQMDLFTKSFIIYNQRSVYIIYQIERNSFRLIHW